jgi:formylglycine-generating enzyme required for sulfatase activity
MSAPRNVDSLSREELLELVKRLAEQNDQLARGGAWPGAAVKAARARDPGPAGPALPAGWAADGEVPRCSSCGSLNPKGNVCCVVCGTELAPTGEEGAPTVVLAGDVGAPKAPAPGGDTGDLAAKCEACGEVLPATGAFCVRCGARSGATSQRAPAAPDPGPGATPADVPAEPDEEPQVCHVCAEPMRPEMGYCESCGAVAAGSATAPFAGEPELPPVVLAEDPPDVAAEGARARAPERTRGNARRWLLQGVGFAGIALAVATVAGLVWKPHLGTGAHLAEESPRGAMSLTGGAAPPRPAAPPGMVYVPGGEFLMGSDAGTEYERPRHKTAVGPFFVDVHEVTCAEYAKFVEATGRQAPPGWPDGGPPPGHSRRPVTGVSWEDAAAYAAWAGKRLPTEEEWELAARGDDGRRYPWGEEWKPGAANAHDAAAEGVSDVGSHPAGASPWGALDMVGNAWEWTASAAVAYPGGVVPPAPHDFGELKVLRGGYYASPAGEATTTFRKPWPARRTHPVITYENAGLRCVSDVP